MHLYFYAFTQPDGRLGPALGPIQAYTMREARKQIRERWGIRRFRGHIW
jgi:hypothetical protein